MKTKFNVGEVFQPGEVWITSRGGLYRVMAYVDVPGKPRQAVLRVGSDGSGRKVLRAWDAVAGWSIYQHAASNPAPAASLDVHITEGIGGVWFYHLSTLDTNATSLCGARTMNTSMPLTDWGVRGHLNEGWCANCAAQATDALRAAGVVVASAE